MFLQFINTAYGQVTVAAGVIATFWGIFKALGALRKWFLHTKWWQNHAKRRDAQVEMLEIVAKLKEQLMAINSQVVQIRDENVKQSEQLSLLDSDMADSLCTQLTREHDVYTSRGWCAPADKKRLLDIYNRYKSRGRNHLADHYMDDIMDLPEHPRNG